MIKKILCATLSVLALDATHGMMVLYNQDNGAIVRRDVEVSNVDQSEMDAVECVNFRKITPSLLIDENEVSVLIKEYVRTDNSITQIGDPSARRYPLQREMLGYWHNFEAGKSYPTQKLSVQIDDIEFANQSGNIVLDDEYIDAEHALPHKRRCIKYEMDDANLQARQFSEIFISTESGDQVIDEAKVRADDHELPYFEFSSCWLRPDGTVKNKAIAYLTYEDTVSAQQALGLRRIDNSMESDSAQLIIKYSQFRSKATAQKTGVSTDERADQEVREDDAELNYQITETTEEWTASDDTIFTEKTEDVRKTSKVPGVRIRLHPDMYKIDLLNILQLEYRLNSNLPDHLNPCKKR